MMSLRNHPPVRDSSRARLSRYGSARESDDDDDPTISGLQTHFCGVRSRSSRNVVQNSASFFATRKILYNKTENMGEEALPVAEIVPSIATNGLHYKFPDGSSGLTDINLDLPAGSRTLLIGGEMFPRNICGY